MRPESVVKIFLGTILFASCFQYHAITSCLSPRQKLFEYYPRRGDLWKAVAVGVVLFVLRYFWTLAMRPLAERILLHPCQQKGDLQLRVRLLCSNSFKLVFFIATVSFAYYNLHTESWFPAQLGGPVENADFPLRTTFWHGFPFQEVEYKAATYYIVSMGYHMCLALSLLVESPLPDRLENTLQLTLALVLLSSSYLANHIRLGCVLMLLHDVCDVFVSAAKLSIQTRFWSLTFVNSVALFLTWAYFRIFCFVKLILIPIFQQLQEIYTDHPASVNVARETATTIVTMAAKKAGQDVEFAVTAAAEDIQRIDLWNLLSGWLGFVFFLLCLLLLNIYWLSLVVKCLIVVVRSGDLRNLPSTIRDSETASVQSTTARIKSE